MKNNLHADEFFTALHGTWKLDREIVDQHSKEVKTATGTAIWKKTKMTKVLHYHERGKLALPEGEYDFLREYDYQLKPNKINILFADGVNQGELFLSFSFSDDRHIKANHVCKEDHYQASLIVSKDLHQDFCIIFQVKGPKKAYQVKTHYQILD
ncbi:MAG: DUF6314 family protein [Gammaproteobacteria bacterium]|nr:DUF6314 family protein [Gammaproteobacteria bacterium]